MRRRPLRTERAAQAAERRAAAASSQNPTSTPKTLKTSPRGGGALPLAAGIESFVRDHRLRQRDRVSDLADLLREAAGPKVDPHIRPLRLRAGELTVLVDSTSLLQELSSFSGRAIEQRLSELCRERGFQSIKRLVFKHAN